MEPITLEPLSQVDPTVFESHLRPPGKPLLVRGAMDHWPARSQWSLDFFMEYCGKDSVTLQTHIDEDDGKGIHAELWEYLEYIRDPTSGRLAELASQKGFQRPFYCYSYKPFQNHPQLNDHFDLPDFCSDWFSLCSEPFRKRFFPHKQGWLLIGPAGTLSSLHKDAFHTIAWLAQISGRKRCRLFSPLDTPYLYGGKVDPLDPDLDQYPLFTKATPYHCWLEPGDMMFLPPNWWHHVIAEQASITLSFNMINHINFGDYLAALCGPRLPELLKRLP